ncbi:hypothetical protein F2Q69_00011863 [Brassica cretica]|uniref:Uncharacterized protein n=1 Tax=Brassica cretica TaxID=69181 RepID=A0A8S9R707_BRACR|nr:hypothetical protein F2Q69_00011863 [Brassica cretica]
MIGSSSNENLTFSADNVKALTCLNLETLTKTVLSASVLQDSKETVLRSVKTSTSAKRGKPVTARNVAARILGEAMSALVAGSQVRSAWAAVWLIMLSLGLAAGGAYCEDPTRFPLPVVRPQFASLDQTGHIRIFLLT